MSIVNFLDLHFEIFLSISSLKSFRLYLANRSLEFQKKPTPGKPLTRAFQIWTFFVNRPIRWRERSAGGPKTAGGTAEMLPPDLPPAAARGLPVLP